MVKPRLKSLDCAAEEGALLLSRDPRTRIELDDPTGQVCALLMLLREGSRTPEALCAALAEGWPDVEQSDVDEALATLDGLGWLEDAAAPRRLTDYERERYFSNLAFFDAFTTLERSSEEIQLRLVGAHVVVLGAGGLGSSVVQNLAGLGVSRLTLLDFDNVELNARVTGPGDVSALLPGADLVVSAIDQPDEVDLWVNEACVGAGVPFIRGGLAYMQGLYWSVDPGRSACRQCLESYRAELERGVDLPVATWERVLRSERVTRAIGPVAQLLGALVAMEALRYLTGIVPPVSAGTYQLVDFSGDCSISTDPWPQDPDCPVCATVPGQSARPLAAARA